MEERIKKSLKQMSKSVSEMVELVYKAFLENEAHYLNSALNKEQIVDDLEKEITSAIIESGKKAEKDQQKKLILLGQIAENIERMGDELRYLMERVELKIAEGLFFSDLGIQQYQELFEKMRYSVNLTAEFLEKDKQENLHRIQKNGEEIKRLVEEYRVQHMERLAKGICEPRAANIFFDMLDFTGNVARHCTNIARIHKEG